MNERIVGGISPLIWYGGKFYAAKKLLPYFPKHHCYVEPFCGAANVFFQKTHSNNEILNDINGDLINFFRVLRNSPDYFAYRASHTPASRQFFMDYLEDKEIQCCKERAWRFFYLNRLSFAGMRMGNGKIPSCAASAEKCRGKLIKNTIDRLEIFTARLRDAYIENLAYTECIARYDHKDTFFYIDPPYVGQENAYGNGYFARSDYAKLAHILEGIKGKFLLSLNDNPLAHEIFGRFNSVKIDVKYFANDKNGAKEVCEMAFANYPLRKSKQKSLLEE